MRTEKIVIADPYAVVGSAVKTASAFSVRTKADCGCGGCGDKQAPTSDTPARRVDPHRAALSHFATGIGPIGGRRNIVDLKAAIRSADESVSRMPLHGPDDMVLPVKSRLIGSKSGLVSSRSRAGRAAQALVSYAVPGDMSRVRSPIRSTLYRAITPGGGRGGLVGRIGGEQIVNRCPPGFENGGRFANSTFTNCGRQLFEAIQAIAEGAQAAGRGGRLRVDNTPAPSILRGARVAAGKYTGEAIAISRAANVARMGAPSPKKRDESVRSTVAAANSSESAFARMVRADGVVFSPVSDLQRIAKQRKNPDMEGATWVTALNSPQSIGGDEIALFGAGIRSIRYAVPGSGEIRVDSTKPLGQARTNALIRKMQAARAKGDENGSALRAMVRESGGDLVYSESFPNVDKPNEMVVIAKGKERKTVPRWVYEAWYSDKSSGKDKSSGWTVVDAVTNVSSQNEVGANVVAEATAESLSALSSFDRGKAIAKGKASDFGAGRKSVLMKDGTNWVVHRPDADSHIGVVVGNDIATALGVQAPNSYLAGEAKERYAVVESPNEITGVKITKDGSTDEIPGEELAKIALVDYLTDNRGRTPATIVPSKGKGGGAVSMSSPRNALAGRGGAKKPSDAGFADYLKQDGSSKWLAERASKMENVREKIAAMYEQLLERAEQFDWEAYMDRLAIAGLTDGEKTHLETIKGLYEARVKQMRSSRKAFLTVFGVAS